MEESGNMVIKGFTVVPVQVSAERQVMQHLYLKGVEWRHSEPDDWKPPERTVFVGNTPPWMSEKDFEKLFKCCGAVERVILQHAPSRTKEEPDAQAAPFAKINHRVGYIVFKDKRAVERALQLSYSKPLVLPSEGTSALCGLARYKEAYFAQKCDVAEMKKNLKNKVSDFDQKEKEREEEEKAKEEPDEEGWVTVTKHGKYNPAPRIEAEDKRIKMKMKIQDKKKELVNFYHFQKRNEQKQRIDELRKKFEQDKSAIEKMKTERRFRPF